MRFLRSRLSKKYLSTGAGMPVARRDELIVEEFGDELLIYDQRTGQAHCLGSAARRVWQASDGLATVERLGVALGLDQGTVARAIEELAECGLLSSPRAAGVTRREATARLAKAGAAAVSAPLIYSIAAPAPALAASQAICTAVGCVGACGPCNSLNCACCDSTNLRGPNKLCVADCSLASCSGPILAAHGCGSGLASCTPA